MYDEPSEGFAMRLLTRMMMMAGALALWAGPMACDSGGGGSTPVFTADTSGASDATGGPDGSMAGDTGEAAGDVATADDATSAEDTSVATDDTSAPEDTTPAVERQCTDTELSGFNTCAQACSGDQTCQQGCFNSELSAACKGAYQALGACAQGAGCASNDAQCVVENCPSESAAVFGNGPEPGDCDPVADTGCEEGQTCTLVSQTATGCAPKGTAGYGEDCSTTGCAQGACLTFDGTNFECLEFCDPMNNTCREGRPCNVGAQGTDLTFCGDIPVACDVFAQDCDGGEGCYLVDSQGNTDCLPSQNKQPGESCQYVSDCTPGYICGGQPATCVKACQTDGTPTGCPEGEQCASLGVQNFGACVPGQ